MRYLVVALFLSFISVFAQDDNVQLSGNLHQDFMISSQNVEIASQDSNNINFKKRSPLLAGGLSLILPGAGQFYNKDYWKTAIFAVIEIAAISTAIIYNGKGDDQTESYKNFANSTNGWDVNKYAEWTHDNAQRINPGIEENDPVLNIF